MTDAPDPDAALAAALPRLAVQEYQVWAVTPQGGVYAYRTDLGYSVARRWSDYWNAQAPADVPPGSAFRVVRATTEFSL